MFKTSITEANKDIAKKKPQTVEEKKYKSRNEELDV